ncbi:MAG TPA: indolepyruvate ferredoxin oxidoreductase family protein [Geminicoccus sp.]|uniref:indolepyruvate ferredoxin oxidoreductase family protein n=1 Tax=Geminicoccus sp. TaxID=2024832 RepID=UPI002C9E0B57|nr:indolepyruvate ferredoxin oxidoreductase family protein [Geminicoccus sp.]HWL68003.1 indolepyruvate ferredoxin oxidoreductase family protein [Geminicoccus sp.]
MTDLQTVSLDDKYLKPRGRVFLTGIQALVRLPMEQRRRDQAAGLNTAGYITGYRGSPLGQYDQQLTRAKKLLDEHHIVFQPGVNEDLAATACSGTQQAALDGENKYDGVFAIWYAKGPGVDRSGDALRHANLFGTAAHGGYLCLLGDDHTCESSTTAHQSEPAMIDAMIPVLNPAGVQEILDYGLIGIAMSRYSGALVALKCVHDTVESTVSAEIDPARLPITLPDDFPLPEGGLNIRWPDTPLAMEERLHRFKLEAAKAFARANRLDRTVMGGDDAWLGVATTGKAWLDTIQALDDLGIDEARAKALGLRVYKVGMSWPLEPRGLEEAARGLSRLIVVEEKRPLVEDQVRSLLYGQPNAPVIEGKHDRLGRTLFPSWGAINSNQVALAIGRALLERAHDPELAERLAEVEARVAVVTDDPAMLRLPYFCPGCPHNTSTKVPEGSKARAGIGCHYMAQWMDRDTARYTQMGGEGASWLGEAPFSTREHVFQNIGDGTFYHSGSLAIRAAMAAKANITFKILYNDAVAMTGGQKMETANLDVAEVTRLLHAEGVGEIHVVTDEPHKYPIGYDLADGVKIHHRDELDALQRRLRTVPGVTAIVYDQTCAAEKRRRRKRGEFPDPDQRVVINELVCEGCGDCGVQSNCVAVQPVETELGRKRRIDQSACNKDFSCLKGFCPSFVTIEGAVLKKGERRNLAATAADLPLPALPAIEGTYGIVVTGIGGTGVVTIAALLGMAAHLENKGIAAIDMIGLAQKGGAVLSHLKIAKSPDEIGSPRVAAGGAKVLIGCDQVVAASKPALATVRAGVTRAVVNLEETFTGDFTRNADFSFPAERLRRAITRATGEGLAEFVDGSRIATGLIGDSIATNLFMVGFAWQRGLIPLGLDALMRAIELNGVAVAMNQAAFTLGRRAAHDLAAVQAELAPAAHPPAALPADLDGLVARRMAFLTDYQDRRYAERYERMVKRARLVEQTKLGTETLARTVAENLFRLMAFKDEYEVARLWSHPSFQAQLAREFQSTGRLTFHLAPPMLAKRDHATGQLRKSTFGPWMRQAFRLLRHGKALRFTPFDPFGRTEERRTERALIGQYETLVEELLAGLTPANRALAEELAAIPSRIRGFGHVKERNLQAAKAREAELLARFRARPEQPVLVAAE